MMDPNSVQPFRGGELIAGKYRVDSVLGAGGMGVVLAATHLDLDRKVAVKVIRPELAYDEALVERLLHEARAAARIKSEHVGKVLDVARLPDGAPYIVMEFLEGRDLGLQLEQDGALPSQLSVDLLLQACEAVAEAHAAQIVHRDLKPENLFVVTQPDQTLCIKVLDFGIAKQLGDPARRALTNPTTAVGSPQYMAPEQMRAEEVDTRVDIWALGAILYEMLSGRKAFDAETLPAICARVLADEPRPLREVQSSVPALLEQIVHRCLSKHRTQRYGSVAELAEALAPFGSSQADLSWRRIRALSQHIPRVPAELAETVMAGERISVSLTAKGVSHTLVAQPRVDDDDDASRLHKLPLWPVFLGAAAAVTLAIVLWNWARVPPDRARAAATGISDPATQPSSSASARLASATATPTPQVPLAPPAPSTELTSAVAASDAPSIAAPSTSVLPLPAHEAPTPSGAQRSPTPARKFAPPATSKPTSETSETPKPGAADAWDPDNFGSRH
jgi:eukaryotic-like serine/threonine-protein kinase